MEYESDRSQLYDKHCWTLYDKHSMSLLRTSEAASLHGILIQHIYCMENDTLLFWWKKINVMVCCIVVCFFCFFFSTANKSISTEWRRQKKYQNLNPEIINDQDHVTHTKSNYNTIFWAQFVFSHSWKYVVSVPISNYFLINYI